MNISELTLDQLKALAYDQILIITQTQNNLKILEQRIAELEKQKAPVTNIGNS